ncbi:hypothetical protein Sjap_007371 [Stephania japonica]|uniref:Wall-associated receptor kinase-like 20 n=1 Tax=Stephania japonica TaxID=461633 RepID=A0AAP0PAC5_9MAGN
MESLVMILAFLVSMFVTSFPQVSPLKVCPKCGAMEVPLPLSTNNDCGDSSYKVYCNNGVLEFLSAEGVYYKILGIDPCTQKLIIATPRIRKDICYSSDLIVGGLRIDENSPFNISTRNTVMLLNCSENLLLSPLNCSSNSLCRLFEEKVHEGSACRNTLCCTFLKDASITSHRIRARVGGCTAYTSVVNMKPDEFPGFWNYGIELQWLPSSLY